MSRKLIIIPFAALILIAAAPVPSAAQANNEQQNGASAETRQAGGGNGKAERKTCKFFQMSGSNMRGERLCMTAAQWKEFYAAQE